LLGLVSCHSLYSALYCKSEIMACQIGMIISS
jgi:hypothetical protein